MIRCLEHLEIQFGVLTVRVKPGEDDPLTFAPGPLPLFEIITMQEVVTR